MALFSTNIANTRDYVNTVKFLVWNQFPAILERSIRHFAVLPETGIYRLTNPQIRDFKRALLENLSRQFTISGIGSLIDYDTFGHQIKKPTPDYYSGGCNGNTLCLEPTCFGFVEGVIENNNMIQNMCWSLAMPCLKDHFYSDSMFEQKIQEYFRMFFAQAPGVLQAYQRTNLLRESIKIVATNRNFRYTGTVIGGEGGISLPFYINPTDPTAFPDLDVIPGNIGGINLDAFAKFIAPRLFSGAFEGGMKSVTTYGQEVDWEIAREQTLSVQDTRSDMENLQSRLDRLMGGGLTADGMFPTFKLDADNVVIPITQEILQASTIAGYQQTTNPEHSLASIRGLLFVPSNWRYNLVEPPIDDFSFLGLGGSLNFALNTPGVFRLSSQMFRENAMAGQTVILGQKVDGNGNVIASAEGLRRRDRMISEAVRTDVIMTYASQTCGAPDGQITPVGAAAVTQGRADGFALKSTMYIGSDVQGTARPVLVLFKTDTPRSARPIEVCTVEEVEIDSGGGLSIANCCPGVDGTLTLSFTQDGSTTAAITAAVAAAYTEGDIAIYRTGPKGSTYNVEITAVSGAMVAIQAIDSEGEPDTTVVLPCCSGVPDDYGTLGELLVVTGATATSSGIFKAECDPETGILTLELYEPIAAATAADEATITLADGSVIEVEYDADADAGVFITVVATDPDADDLCALECGCLVNAVFAVTIVT